MLVLAALAPGAPVAADPRSDSPTSTAQLAAGSAGPVRADLVANPASIAAGDPFAFTTNVVVPVDTSSLTIRLQLRHPTGRLIFQRTRIAESPAPGRLSELFTRETADLSLRPGAYPVTVDVFARVGGETYDATLESSLLVYDADTADVPVVVAARVTGEPLTGPVGELVSDPAVETRARDEARDLASWVLAERRARLTLALPPLLVEEWQRIASEGYTREQPGGGVVTVAPDDPVARGYEAALATIRTAVATGRLELVTTGYADPDLAALGTAGLADDVTAHYERGVSVLRSSLETTPSTGTVPAGGFVTGATLERLDRAGVAYAIVRATSLRSGSRAATSTAYSVRGSRTVLLAADQRTSRAVAAGDSAALVDAAFSRALAGTSSPYVIAVDVGTGASSASTVTASLEPLLAHGWARLATGAQAADRPRREARAVGRSQAAEAPDGHWEAVRDSRRWAEALSSAIGASASEALTAERDSLIAASSAWAGVDGRWRGADRGREFADTATRIATETLGGVSVSVSAITLAGTAGDLPVTVRNDSGRPLDVTVMASGSQGVAVGSVVTTMALEPQENYLQVPIELVNALDGRVRVSVLAGDVVLDTVEVSVAASYLDRIVLIAGIVVIMAGVLVFVIRRVRAQEALAGADETDAGYTGRRDAEASDPRDTRDPV